MQEPNKPRVIISGGGTGGHINPALAIADEVRRRYPESQILFVGALGRMEMERVPAAGYEIVGDVYKRQSLSNHLTYKSTNIVKYPIQSWEEHLNIVKHAN